MPSIREIFAWLIAVPSIGAGSYLLARFVPVAFEEGGFATSIGTMPTVWSLYGLFLMAGAILLIKRNRFAVVAYAPVMLVAMFRWAWNMHSVFPAASGRPLTWDTFVNFWASQQFFMFLFSCLTLLAVAFHCFGLTRSSRRTADVAGLR
jgi:hypothetical protein